MIVGVPREIKQDEYRVAMIPVGVEEMRKAGHKVLVQTKAGEGSGIPEWPPAHARRPRTTSHQRLRRSCHVL